MFIPHYAPISGYQLPLTNDPPPSTQSFHHHHPFPFWQPPLLCQNLRVHLFAVFLYNKFYTITNIRKSKKGKDHMLSMILLMLSQWTKRVALPTLSSPCSVSLIFILVLAYFGGTVLGRRRGMGGTHQVVVLTPCLPCLPEVTHLSGDSYRHLAAVQLGITSSTMKHRHKGCQA